MVILGIDPGLVQTGFGIISVKDRKIDMIDYGIIKPNAKADLPKRLLTIHEDVKSIIVKYSPKIVVIEDNFRSGLYNSLCQWAIENNIQNRQIISIAPEETYAHPFPPSLNIGTPNIPKT